MFSLYLWDFTSYLPQHCLYFLPLPHARPLTIFYLYMVQIVLCVFPLFYGHLVHYIISIIYIINITNFICYVDKMWTKIIFSQHFVSDFIISFNHSSHTQPLFNILFKSASSCNSDIIISNFIIIRIYMIIHFLYQYRFISWFLSR